MNIHSCQETGEQLTDLTDRALLFQFVCLLEDNLAFESYYNDCEDMMWSKFQSCRSFNLANLHINAPSALKMSMSAASQLIQQQWRAYIVHNLGSGRDLNPYFPCKDLARLIICLKVHRAEHIPSPDVPR